MSRNLSRTALFLVLVCTLLPLVVSCGVKRMALRVRRPAEINMRDYKRIAVADIDGWDRYRAGDLSDALVTYLLESGTFEVLDRQHLGMILDEHDLTLRGIVDEDAAIELGKFIGSAALIFGRVQTDHFEEEVTKGEPYTDKKGKEHQKMTRTGTYTLAVHFSVIDVQTGKILGVKDISARPRAQTTADNRRPERIDREALSREAIDIVCSHFMRYIAPYTVTVMASFESDKQLPELDRALTQFRIGETYEALSILERACQRQFSDSRTRAKAHYNLGLAQMYAGIYDESYQNLREAYGIKPTSRYEQAIAQLRMEKDAADRLREQEE